ncbi:YdcF family protein [Sphaerimonospora cavernae]|uniref:YdcF family protein n=1 Tax=Sphaerimonospora cavernae TaxID=1740611 RepID=A0ABV6UDS3_9ACTN
MSDDFSALPQTVKSDLRTLWDYHDMHHEPRPCDIGVGLGSHDIGVAVFTAELYHRQMLPRIVFSGANAPTTIDRFPRGEAVHYREEATRRGVPAEVILVEPCATNTGENIQFTRRLLASQGVHPASIMLITRPYQQRRAFATCKKLWPEPEVICASRPLPLEEYVASIGDTARVINMIVGDTQRITEYPKQGFAIPQEMPDEVEAAYQRLVDAGFTSRLLPV